MHASHHPLPVDLSRQGEPVYFGLDLPRSGGLALCVFLSLSAATWSSAFFRDLLVGGVWAGFLFFGFATIEGFPVPLVLRWFAGWVGRKLRQPTRRGPQRFGV